MVTVSLDWLSERMSHPDVIKIDVEGAEREVLTGGESLIKSCLPIVLCEVSAHNSKYVYNYFKDLGYRLFDTSTKDFLDSECKTATENTVAIPDVECVSLNRRDNRSDVLAYEHGNDAHLLAGLKRSCQEA